MIEFHDYDPSHPFDVTEKRIIANNKVTLNYAPLKGSVAISGLVEDFSGSVPQGTFFINYGDEDNYRSADQIVHFPEGYDGAAVTISYKGVSTLLRAEHMNEIKSFIEKGAGELAARIIAEHEQFMADKYNELFEIHCKHICAELKEIKQAIAALGGGGISTDLIADDEEADTLLDEYFPGDVETTEKVPVIAEDDEADIMLDEFFPGDVDDTDIATDEEAESMLDEFFPEV